MLTEKLIQNALFDTMFDLKDSKGQQEFYYLTPNVNLFDWESDMIAKSKDERIFEFEIKTSREDFFNDLKKKRTKILSNPLDQTRKPNLFYYILPMDCVKDEEIPEWAGYYFYRHYQCTSRGLIIEFFLKRKAVKLTNKLISTQEILTLLTSVYFKYWRARRGKGTRVQKKVG